MSERASASQTTLGQPAGKVVERESEPRASSQPATPFVGSDQGDDFHPDGSHSMSLLRPVKLAAQQRYSDSTLTVQSPLPSPTSTRNFAEGLSHIEVTDQREASSSSPKSFPSIPTQGDDAALSSTSPRDFCRRRTVTKRAPTLVDPGQLSQLMAGLFTGEKSSWRDRTIP